MTLRYDISQHYALKSVIEQIFGNQAWLDLKECTSIPTWRKYVQKLFTAVRISIEESIDIRDEACMVAVHENLDHGINAAKSAKDIDDLLSVLSATLLRQVFLQIRQLPNRRTARKVTLARENWKLNNHRTVQYVQAPRQVEALFWSEQQRKIGPEKQMELFYEHRTSKSNLPFSQWCSEQEA